MTDSNEWAAARDRAIALGLSQQPEPLQHPQVAIEVKVTISGDWVTPDVIADTAHALAMTLARELNGVDPGSVPVTLDVKMDPP